MRERDLVPVERAGTGSLRTKPRFWTVGPPEVRCDEGTLARVRPGREGLLVETTHGSWRHEGTPDTGVQLFDAAGTQIAQVGGARVFSLDRRGHLGATEVRYRPRGAWGRGGVWTDGAGRTLMVVRARDQGWRRWVTCEPAGDGCRPDRGRCS